MPLSIEQLDARLTTAQANPADPQPRHYTRLAIVSNDKGESVLFARDANNWRLTIWLPEPSTGQWTFFDAEFEGMPYVEDFDLLSNHLQGRKDDTIDLVVLGKNAAAGQCQYFPALPFSTKLEDWQSYFSKPIDLTSFLPEESDQVRLGLLPKARRSVFISSSVSATRCDVDEAGKVTEYPFDLGPEWNKSSYNVFAPCVAARLPGSYTFDDGLVGSYSPSNNKSVVKVMLPKAPLGNAWELTPLPPLVGFQQWSTVTGISTFRRPDTGEPIITYVMSKSDDSPLNKAVWVMDNDTLYHSDKGCWWLAAPTNPEQIFPPPAWAPARALPVQMQADKPPTWIWLQVGATSVSGVPYSLIESRSAEFSNRGSDPYLVKWIWTQTKYFEASLAASSTVPGETTARIFAAGDNPASPATLGLLVWTLDNATGKWMGTYVPLPPPPAGA